ncbi:MAG TPA: hypothetical protein VN517_17530, partial [Terriglobales bacterium]|nr:hypothetical protein [Terriglobales bacterium]
CPAATVALARVFPLGAIDARPEIRRPQLQHTGRSPARIKALMSLPSSRGAIAPASMPFPARNSRASIL